LQSLSPAAATTIDNLDVEGSLMGRIVSVIINRDGCLLHGCCRDIFPEVFGWPRKDAGAPPGDGAFVKEGAEKFLKSHEHRIREACAACPVAVISLHEQ